MRKVISPVLPAVAVLLLVSCSPKTGKETVEMNRFIDKLMKEMTLEEKLGQMNLPSAGDITTGEAESTGIAEKIRQGQVGGLFNIKGQAKIRAMQRIAVEESRLKIPMIFGMDVIHGYETGFPIPLGMAATWNMEAVERSARIAAVEASADGICWTFSPMADINRDPRWGRVAEGNGEDVFLAGRIIKAMVYGYQGRENPYSKDDQIMACVKHYALYGASESGRDYNTVDMSRVRMFNEYLYPYQAAVEAGVGSVMASFNEVDGIPATANRWLMTDVLRDMWGFEGFVVTDYTGIREMVDHGIGDLQTVSARALAAGIDMDMVSEGFISTLPQSLRENKVTQQQIDQACRRVLEAKYKLGLFRDPYRFCKEERAKTEIFTPEHRAEARKIAAESFVLLKNTGVLPLKKQGSIAVVGPLADTRSNMAGTWSVAVRLDTPSTLVEGMRSVAGDKARILYAKGSNLTEDYALEMHSTVFGRSLNRDERTKQQLLNEALQVARQADVIVAALGESSEMSGEASSRTDIRIPDVQRELLSELLKTGKPVVVVLFTGRPLVLTAEDATVPAILNVWFGGTEAAEAIADVVFGDVNPSGKLPITFPRDVGQIPIYYNHKNTGRPLAEGKWFQKYRSNYLDVPNEPLYPFGYGLSYTRFEYGDVSLNSEVLEPNGELKASVTVTNTGRYDGYEVVQLYIRDLVGSITRPVKELKGFEKVFLKAGESKTVSFGITPELLKFYNYDLEHVAEPGDFEAMVGGNSRDVRMAKFTLK